MPRADGFPLSGMLYLPPRGEPDTVVARDAPARRFLAPLPRAAARGRRLRVLRRAHAVSEPRRRHAARARCSLDVAGTIAWLRARGFRQVVLLGNSGGGSLFAFYLAAGGEAAGRAARARAVGRSRCRSARPRCRRPTGSCCSPRISARARSCSTASIRRSIDEADPVGHRPAARHVRPAQRLPADDARGRRVRAGLRRRVPRRAARALRAARCAARARGARRRVDAHGAGSAARAAGRARARSRVHALQRPLLPHLPDARRPALSRPDARPVAAAARLDLLLRPRSRSSATTAKGWRAR